MRHTAHLSAVIAITPLIQLKPLAVRGVLGSRKSELDDNYKGSHTIHEMVCLNAPCLTLESNSVTIYATISLLYSEFRFLDFRVHRLRCLRQGAMLRITEVFLTEAPHTESTGKASPTRLLP